MLRSEIKISYDDYSEQWAAWFPGFDGIIGVGKTIADAADELERVFPVYISARMALDPKYIVDDNYFITEFLKLCHTSYRH